MAKRLPRPINEDRPAALSVRACLPWMDEMTHGQCVKEWNHVIEDLLRKPDRESGGEAERTPVEGSAGQGPVCVHEGRGAERQFGEVAADTDVRQGAGSLRGHPVSVHGEGADGIDEGGSAAERSGGRRASARPRLREGDRVHPVGWSGGTGGGTGGVWQARPVPQVHHELGFR